MHVKHVVGAAIAMLALAGPSLGAGHAGVPIRVTGTQTPVNEAQGKFQMHGSLVGPWQITSFKPMYVSATQFAAKGTELFTGCLDSNRNGACESGEPSGTLRFAATFWGELSTTTKKEIRGGCFHSVAGGTGDFAKAKGVLAMLDTPVGKDVKTTYRGELQLAPSAANAMRVTQGVRPAASSAAC